MRTSYDDLMGLDMYDEGMMGLDGFYSAEQAKEQFIAAGSSAAAIMLAAWGMPKLPAPESWQPENQHRLRAGLGLLAGLLLSRGLWNYNRDAAMAVLGGVGGLAVAQLIDSYLEMDILHGMPLGNLPQSSALSAQDEALLTAYSPDTGTLSLTEVAASRDPFAHARGGMGGPIVTPEQLMGFGGPVVAAETLGEGYNPYLA